MGRGFPCFELWWGSEARMENVCGSCALESKGLEAKHNDVRVMRKMPINIRKTLMTGEREDGRICYI